MKLLVENIPLDPKWSIVFETQEEAELAMKALANIMFDKSLQAEYEFNPETYHIG